MAARRPANRLTPLTRRFSGQSGTRRGESPNSLLRDGSRDSLSFGCISEMASLPGRTDSVV